MSHAPVSLDRTLLDPVGVWRRFWRNRHVRCELGALCYLVVGIAALVIGLRIAPAVCIAIALGMIGSDLYDIWHPRH